MGNAEANGALADEQYGSRKRHAAPIQALNKRLLFDILRQERRAATDTAVDLKSRYNLVSYAAASMSMRRMAAPRSVVRCIFTTLQNMVHTVRIIYEDSEKSFSGTL